MGGPTRADMGVAYGVGSRVDGDKLSTLHALALVTGRPRRLRAALAAVLVQAQAHGLALVHRWLDTSTGVGAVAVGLHRQGWDLQLTQYGDGRWRATFYVTGMAHSLVGGSAWEPTPWTATQQAASQALNKGADDDAVFSNSFTRPADTTHPNLGSVMRSDG
jgi:hypothetical protein